MSVHGDAGVALEAVARDSDLSGVVHLSQHGETIFEMAGGFADRAHEISNTINTQFAIASGAKGFTALAVMSLIDEGALELTTTAREVLGDELEEIDAAVTIEHLLGHTSGIGDYLDEDDLDDISAYLMPVPVHQLAEPRDYLAVLRGHPMKFPPGTRFSYCNGGYVVLALIIEAVAGSSYFDVLHQRVFAPADMTSTAFLRSDQLPGRAAIGYLADGDGWRTNHLHLPVRGVGDGGAYSTVGDVARFWAALFDGRIVPPSTVENMVRVRSEGQSGAERYGLGFWLGSDRDTVVLEGFDAGVSFRSAYDRPSGLLYTVISNTPEGAWPIGKELERMLPELAGD